MFFIFIVLFCFSAIANLNMEINKKNHPIKLSGTGSTVTGMVWFDQNIDGTQDGGESVLPNVPVTLYNCNGIFVASVATQSDGSFAFSGIDDGSYKIYVSPTNVGYNYSITIKENDNSINPSGYSECFSVNDGDVEVLNIGFTVLPVIGDKVWEDINGNGVLDSGEPGINDLRVSVFDTNGFIASVVTDTNGYYSFTSLYPGSYYLNFDAPSDYTATKLVSSPLNSVITNANGQNTSDYFYLEAGNDLLFLDAGFYKCAKICGLIYNDLNSSDSLNTNENGFNGLYVYLWEIVAGDTILHDFTTTGKKPGSPSDDGYYEFCVPPGEYFLEVNAQILTGFIPGLPFITSDPATSNHFYEREDENERRITTDIFTVESGGGYCEFNQGFYCVSTIESIVWLDENRNGIRENDEPLLEDISVDLYNATNSTLVATTTSDSDGKIVFTKIKRGNYFLKFCIDESYIFSEPFVGSEFDDSNVDGSHGYGTTNVLNINDCKTFIGFDAGVLEIVLPVEWGNIYSEKHSKFNRIIWEVQTESNVSHYIVEKSQNGHHWTTVETLRASGRDLRNNRYKSDDFDIYSAMTYYRITSLDYDGYKSLSRIIKISRSEDGDFITFPNPVNDIVNIGYYSKDNYSNAPLELNIFNNLGQLIYSHKFDLNSTLSLDTNNWIEGVYQVVILKEKEILDHTWLIIAR